MPPLSTNDKTATFEFTSDLSGVTFECALDRGPFNPCASSYELTGLTDGEHIIAPFESAFRMVAELAVALREEYLRLHRIVTGITTEWVAKLMAAYNSENFEEMERMVAPQQNGFRPEGGFLEDEYDLTAYAGTSTTAIRLCAASRSADPATPTWATCSPTAPSRPGSATASTPPHSASTQKPNRSKAPRCNDASCRLAGASLCFLIQSAKPTSSKLASMRELWR